jgi:hypothetical protein
MGRRAVALTMPGHWVLCALINNQWSFAGWGDKSGQCYAGAAIHQLQFSRWLVF